MVQTKAAARTKRAECRELVSRSGQELPRTYSPRRTISARATGNLAGNGIRDFPISPTNF